MHAARGVTPRFSRSAEPRFATARRQRLCWAAAGTHRRLATGSDGKSLSPVFRWLSDDLVAQVGERISTFASASKDDWAAVAAADGRWMERPMRPTQAGGPPAPPAKSYCETCVLQ